MRQRLTKLVALVLLTLPGYGDSGTLDGFDPDTPVSSLQNSANNPNPGLGEWHDPNSVMGGVRARIREGAAQSPALSAWFCRIDANITGGGIGLVMYRPTSGDEASQNAGWTDSDSAGVPDTLAADLRERTAEAEASGDEMDEEARRSSEDRLAEALVHELVHVDQAQFLSGCDDGTDLEQSACSCEHAGAYKYQLLYVLATMKVICETGELGEIERMFRLHYNSYPVHYAKWQEHLAACDEFRDTDPGHGLNPSGPAQGTGPDQVPGNGWLPWDSNLEIKCAEISGLFPNDPEGGPGGGGGSDPSLCGDTPAGGE